MELSRCNSTRKKAVDAHLKKYGKELSCGGKYNRNQIQGKLRQIHHHGPKACKNHEYVSSIHATNKKNKYMAMPRKHNM